MEVNVGQMFANRAFLTPDLEAFVGKDYRYSFDEANKRVNRIAGLFKKKGVSRGDRIAVLGKNNEHVATSLFGASKIGALTVLLNWRLQAPELAYILSDCGASMLIYDGAFSGAVDQLRSAIPAKTFIRVGEGSPSDIELNEALDGISPDEPGIAGGGEDPTLLMYTSGTTGKAKGAALTHNNLFWASIGLTHTIDWPHKSRYLSVAPLFHIGGLAPIMANVHAGCTSIFMSDFHPVELWKTVVEERITLLMTVPVMLKHMKMVPFEKMDLSSLRQIICGGSAVPPDLIAAYRRSGVKVQHVYGATEYSGAITFWTHDMDLDKIDSMGKPVFHGDVKILNPVTGAELPAGQVGEICLFGPQVFKGYWNNEKYTMEAIKDGCFKSGDLGKKDEDGYVYVIDRLKDMIISGGENIYPAEIELVLQNHPGVADVAVTGKLDEKWGEIPVAFIVKQPNVDIEEEAIVETCRKNLAGYKCVKEVRFVDAIPRNSVGKILKAALREILTGPQGSPEGKISLRK